MATIKNKEDSYTIKVSPNGSIHLDAGTQGTVVVPSNLTVYGTINVNGLQGLQSIQGLNGAQGIQGIQGIDGSGTDGAQGIQGIQGLDGTIGPAGAQGIQGIQGIDGSGADGAQGIQGIQGLDGTIGPEGAQGIQGIDGSGADGAQGIQGIQGISGNDINRPYIISGIFYGSPASEELILLHVSPYSVTFASNLTSSYAVSIGAATANTDFSITVNDISVGTMSFAAAASIATFSSSGFTLSPGDIIKVISPVIADGTLSTISFSLVGVR